MEKTGGWHQRRGDCGKECGGLTGSQVRLVVDCFVGEEEEFEVDVLRDREPVELLKDRCDVVKGAGVVKQARECCYSSRVWM